MTNPCERGFDCPHKGIGEDGDYICLYPHTRWDAPEDDVYWIIDSVDCPLEDPYEEVEE